MRLLFDCLTIVLFFFVYKSYDIFAAVVTAMIAYSVQVTYLWLRYRHVESIQLITLALILILGGATLLFHNETFFFWKPTAVYWLFTGAFLASHLVGEKTALQRLMGHAVTLPAVIWHRLNMIWAIFFFLLGLLNLYVAYHYSLDTWVNFKLFGLIGITFLFIILQGIYMARHIKTDEHATNK